MTDSSSGTTSSSSDFSSGDFSKFNESDSGLNDSESGALVTARGTAEGLILRLVSDANPLELQAALRDFLISRSGFLKGASVFVEWVDELPSTSLQKEVEKIMKQEFSVEIQQQKKRDKVNKATERASEKKGSSRKAKRGVDKGDGVTRKSGEKNYGSDDEVLSLFDGVGIDDVEVDELNSGLVGQVDISLQDKISDDFDSEIEDELFNDALGDVPDCRMIIQTLRSGQRIESEHSVVVLGDVNSGAEIIAGGDIIVLGKLRGVAHAGAYDETGGGRVIFSLDLSPTQLRIGAVITRGSGDDGVYKKLRKVSSRSKPEIARVEGNLIVVEQYEGRGISR